ncbi:MAG TPA: hypothetical protein PLD51_06690 [Pontiellaceae bacterium]|nr:hypothetical protein [Pontiellaceae bacterium]
MKQKLKIAPKYFHGLLGALLVVMVVQYALLTGLVHPIHLVFQLMQLFCYLLLTVTVFRGFIQRSRLAWLISQMMLAALFSFSLLFTVVSAVLSFQSEGLWLLFGAALVVAVLNGLLLGVLFSLPVCDYFRPMKDDQ